jgi:hypothetical protein
VLWVSARLLREKRSTIRVHLAMKRVGRELAESDVEREKEQDDQKKRGNDESMNYVEMVVVGSARHATKISSALLLSASVCGGEIERRPAARGKGQAPGTGLSGLRSC